ncbi:MAG: 2-dehydropantoate 2-reductase [Proteobacteria bacterium]|nr:2-dehydropantoate 2-reductase [Pseudomonadota bacterium]
MTHIAIFGTGAVGATVGSFLHETGAKVTFISRGKPLEVMKANGLTVHYKDNQKIVHADFVSEHDDFGTPDIILLTVKSYDLPSIAANVANHTSKDTLIIPMINGIPWWHFYGLKGSLENFALSGLDPEGLLAKHIPLSQVLGGVIYVDATMEAPGVVRHRITPKIKIGEPKGKISTRLETLAALFAKAGMENVASPDIRSEIWLKLAWNVCFNPISVLTGATSGPIATDPGTRKLCTLMMQELHALAEKIGIRFALDVEERLAIGVKGGTHKPSMLQDFEAGKRMEIEGIIGAIVEISEKIGYPTPNIATVHALLHEKATIHLPQQTRT